MSNSTTHTAPAVPEPDEKVSYVKEIISLKFVGVRKIGLSLCEIVQEVWEPFENPKINLVLSDRFRSHLTKDVLKKLISVHEDNLVTHYDVEPTKDDSESIPETESILRAEQFQDHECFDFILELLPVLIVLIEASLEKPAEESIFDTTGVNVLPVIHMGVKSLVGAYWDGINLHFVEEQDSFPVGIPIAPTGQKLNRVITRL